MKMYNKLWQISAILIVYSGGIRVGCELFKECLGPEKLNTFVASQSSCAKYIFCDGSNSFEGECIDDNYFNEQEGYCDERNTVLCSVVAGTGTSLSVENGRNNSGVLGEIGDTTTTASVGNNGSNNNTTTINVNMTMQCPLVLGENSLLHLPNPSSCASYYLCYNGIAISMICPSRKYFNAQSSICEPQEAVECHHSPPAQQQCRKGVYEFMPHPRNCEYYYFCSNGFLLIMRCPLEFTWHYERRTCVHRSQSKCFPMLLKQYR